MNRGAAIFTEGLTKYYVLVVAAIAIGEMA